MFMRFNLVLCLLLLVSFFLSLFFGTVSIGLADVASALAGAGDERLRMIVVDIRLPRVLLACLIGAGLGMSGAALQGLLKNPLAEPGVLGVSSGAALGAVVVLYFGLAGLTSFAIPLAAFLGAGLVTFVLVWLARKDSSVLTLILTGVALNSLMGSLTALALNLSPNPYALNDMVLWLMGSLSNRSMADVALVLPFLMIGGGMLWRQGKYLRYMTLGDEVAVTMGVPIARTRMIIIIATALMVAASVSVSGAIGFVGLVVPHMIRPFVAHDPARLIVPSAIGGAILLLWADILVRLLPGGQELQIGVVTALVGGPFFLWIVIESRRYLR